MCGNRILSLFGYFALSRVGTMAGRLLARRAGEGLGGRSARGAVGPRQRVALAKNDVNQADVIAHDHFIGSRGGECFDFGAVFLDADDVLLQYRFGLLRITVGAKEPLPGVVPVLVIGHEHVGEKAVAEDILGNVLGVSLPVRGRQESEERRWGDLCRGRLGSVSAAAGLVFG